MMTSTLQRMMWHATIAVLLLLTALFARIALADDSAPPVPATDASTNASSGQPPGAGGADALALAVAVVAAHEGALDNLRDVDLVWQVVESHAKTSTGRMSWLRKHSPRALGLEECNGRNCLWSVELLRDPNATPASVDQGYWRRVRAPQWALIRERATALVHGRADDASPCPQTPYTWGGAMDHDGAIKRGLLPLGCVGTLNDGFALKARAVDAREASER